MKKLKKRPADAGPGRLCCGGFVAPGQPVVVTFLPERKIRLHPLFCSPPGVIQPVFFQHGWQPLTEHSQAQGIPVAVGFHIRQIGMIQIQTRLTRNDVGIANIHTVRLRQCLQIATKIKCLVGVALDAERLVGVLL